MDTENRNTEKLNDDALPGLSRSWFRPVDALIAAFLVPVIVMLIIFVAREIFPFGEKSFLRTDMYHQYAPFFAEFRNKLTSGGSLLHSWDIGLGVNFAALYAYYLASPFNWLIALVPAAYVIEFMTYLIVIKIGLAGLAMAFYLNRHQKNSYFMSAYFAIFYALSGYVAAYSWNIMWLDCIILFPIICLGLEKLVEEKKGILYCVSLGACIVTNYYISIMICIFLVIYFFMLVILREKSFGELVKTGLLFAVYSLLAGALAGFLLVPEVLALQSTASADFTFPKTVTQYFTIIDMLARHMVNVETEQTLDHWPNIYCGAAVFVLMILYYLNRRISLKEKTVYSVVCIFFLASFSLNVLNFIWHGMHYPNSLPARQSFIYIFLVLYMGFRAMDEIRGVSVKSVGAAVLGAAAFVLLCQKVITDDAFSWEVYYITLAAAAVYGLLIYLYRTGKANINVLTFAVLAVVAIETAVNTTCTSVPVINRNDYVKNDAKIRALCSSVQDDRDFFRLDRPEALIKDDGAWNGYPSASLFSSTAKAGLSDFLRHFGCETSVNAYSTKGATPLVHALLDIKYLIVKEGTENTGMEPAAVSEDLTLYRNRYVLPVGFAVHGLEEAWSIEAGNPVLVQNELCDIMGCRPVLTLIDGFASDGKYTATIENDGLYFGYSASLRTDKIKAVVAGNEKTFENMKRGYLMNLGWLKKGDVVSFTPDDDTKLSVHVYSFDYDALAELTEVLSRESFHTESFDDAHIRGTVDMQDYGTLLFSIPYDKSWKIKVDGKEITARAYLGALTGLDLAAGHHEIEMRFEPEGLRLGTYASAGAAAVLLLIIVIGSILRASGGGRKKKGETAAENEMEKTAFGTGEAVSGSGPESPVSGTGETEHEDSKESGPDPAGDPDCGSFADDGYVLVEEENGDGENSGSESVGSGDPDTP